MALVEFNRAPATERYLGPARVVEPGTPDLTVRLPTGVQVRARLALAFPYEPGADDSLLVIGDEGEHYVIGVLDGAGDATLAIRGDVSLRAVEGKLRLVGDRGVELAGPDVDVRADRLTLMAETLTQKCTSAFHRVRDLFTFRAGRSHTVVDEASYAKAKRTIIVSDENVMINGKQIHLG
jgi:hypothetical protein